MPKLRNTLYKIYWKLESAIVPELRSSQHSYHETIRKFTGKRPVWLDLGCGHHIFGWWMEREQAEAASEARLVVGMDYDLPNLRKHQVINHRLVGDIARLPFPNDTFELVSANMVLEHLEDAASSLAEIRRVLKPGGAFVFHTPNYRHFWVYCASRTPEFLKLSVIRLFEGRAASDVFPTHYRINTEEAVREQAARAGFAVRDLQLVSTSALTGALGPLSVFELLVLRLLERPSLRRFRADIIGVLEKPAASSGGKKTFPLASTSSGR